MLEKTIESSLDCNEIQTINLKGNQPLLYIEKADAEAETPVLWPPDVKSWFIGKDPDDVKDWMQKKKAAAEYEIVR